MSELDLQEDADRRPLTQGVKSLVGPSVVHYRNASAAFVVDEFVDDDDVLASSGSQSTAS